MPDLHSYLKTISSHLQTLSIWNKKWKARYLFRVYL